MIDVANRAVFFDRDGTLIHDAGYLSDPEKVDPLPGAAEALQRLRSAGFKLFLFTNQSGIGRGYFDLAAAEACNRETEKRLGLSPGFAGICVAPEAPDDPLQIYRKPSPRYIEEMMELHHLDHSEVWMVGDKKSDVEAGLRAGVKSALIGSGKGAPGGVPAFPTVSAFTEWLLSSE